MNEQERKKVEQELRRIEKRDGILMPPAIVEAARPEESVLHRHFQWDDSKAADEYRLWQARRLVGVVLFEREEGDTQREFVSVIVEQKSGSETNWVRAYVNSERVYDDPDLREQVLSDSIRELERWSHKYRHFGELKEVIKAIDRFTKRQLLAAA